MPDDSGPVGDDTPAPNPEDDRFNGRYDDQDRETPDATAGEIMLGIVKEHWFLTEHGGLLYGDGTGGATPYGVASWGEGNEDDQRKALNALGDLAKVALVRRAEAAPDLTALPTAEQVQEWLRVRSRGLNYLAIVDVLDAVAALVRDTPEATDGD